MRVQIVLHQDDFFDVLEVEITDLFEDMGIIDRSAALRDLEMAQPSSGANNMNRFAVPLRSYS